MKKVYKMLAWYRQLFLCYYDYTTTLNKTSKDLYLAALPQVKAAMADYLANWDSYENFSRYETHEMEDFIQRVEGGYPLVLTTSRIIFPIMLGFFIFGIIMSIYYKKPENRKDFKYLNRIIEGSITFKRSILNPRQFFKELHERNVDFFSFLPIICMTFVFSFAFASFNYLEYFEVLFFQTWGILVLLWLYFGGFFYLFGLLFKSKLGLLKTLRYTQYLFIPITVFIIAMFGVYSIFGPEIVWFYLARSIIYSKPLIVAIILLCILLGWLVITGLIAITSTQISWWKAIIMLIIPILILLAIFYYIIDEYFVDIILSINEIFDLINSVFGATQTAASQFF